MAYIGNRTLQRYEFSCCVWGIIAQIVFGKGIVTNMSVRGQHVHQRPELFELISGRGRHSFDAKIKNEQFSEDTYTQMVIEKILQTSDADLNYNEDGFGYLHLAVQNGEPAFVQALIDRGANINSTTNKGSTPLHTALTRYKSNEKFDTIMKILFENGADCDIDFGGMPIKEFAKLSGASKFFDE